MSLFAESAAEPGFPYWWEVAEWPELDGAPPEQVDLLVIGAGFTGLSAAIVAHDAGAKVAVIDAGTPGKGASTRNGGMAGPHPRQSWDALRKVYGESVADGIFAESGPALSFVQELIKREEIDCDFQNTGRIQLAWTEKHFENQRKVAERVKGKAGVDCQVIERDQLGSEIETERYYGGLLIPSHCALHPWKYHNGYVQAVLRRGVPLVAHCPAEHVERVGTGFRVTTPQGVVKADKILLATNGYTPSIFKWHAKRVFPLPSFLIATEELPSNVLGHLAPGRRMMVETRARHSYFRLSPDGKRILYGGRSSMKPIPMALVAKRLHQTLCEVWPEMNDTKVSHVWTGNTGYSFNHMPCVGEQDGIHYSMGYSGSGTVMAPYLGAKAAYRALGDARGETAYARTQFKTHWLHPGTKPYFLHAADFWYQNAVDRWQNLYGR